MPEGPECRLTVDYLKRVLVGQTLVDWIFSGGKYTDEYPDGFETFDLNLPMVIEDVSCKGKFIYFKLKDSSKKNHYILHSLMMTGRWQKNFDDYCKWFLELANGVTVWFRDPRSFATLKFTTSEEVLEEKLTSLGPDIMRPEFTLPKFKNLIKKYSTRNITSFLMDQQVISGCGNYIKAEVLYYARISPLRKTGSLIEREVELLYEGLRIISRVSYNNRGLSLRDYADENGNEGYFERELQVYRKRCMKRTKTPDGRITYWDQRQQI